jgi:hypothetical protein
MKSVDEIHMVLDRASGMYPTPASKEVIKYLRRWLEPEKTEGEGGVEPKEWMTCPRRMNELGPWDHTPNLDYWKKGACSFCGSLHPDKAMEFIEQGTLVEPTDKNYKLYLRGHGKLYFQHLSGEQRAKLVELVNQRKVNFVEPGGFYVLPFFMKRGTKT